jgi:hypothetical protein
MAPKTIKYLISFGALLSVLVIACTVPERRETVFAGRPTGSAEEAAPTKAAEPVSDIPRNTNIHFNDQYCLECHDAVPASQSDDANLRYDGDFKILCRCHYPESGPIHTHPVNIRPPDNDKLTVPQNFPLEAGQITCRSCHDIYIQCRDSEEDRILLQGQMLLRGLPYDNRLDFCFRCHDSDRYQKFNPHQQIGDRGKVIESRCLYCHAEAPDTRQTTWEDVKLIGSFTQLCTGCHYQTAKQPLHVRHLRRPSDPILERMKQMQAEFNIVLPLDRNGRVTCATCHNPHEKGLIPDQRAGARGAGAAHRHRLQDNMCIKCHPMQPIEAFGPQTP